ISLYDQKVTILGGGGITTSLLALLQPFRAEPTVVRRHPDPLPGARTVTTDQLGDVVADAQVLFLALALTPETRGIVDEALLAKLQPTAWVVNVARGGHI